MNGSPTAHLRVSVVLTTHNSGAYLAEQLASVLRQRRPIDEIIVGDDASTDGTRSVLSEMLSGVSATAVDISLHDEHVGFRANVQRAAQRATGDIVCFADHDDVWRDDKVERIVAALAGRPRAAAFSNGRIIDATGNVGRSDLWRRAGFDRADQRAVRDGKGLRVLLAKRVVTGAALACTRDLLDRALPFPDAAVHDYWIALNAAAVGDLFALGDPLIDYRLHDTNAIGLRARNPLAELRRRLDAGDVPGREIEILSSLLTRVGTDMRAEDRTRVERAIDHHEFRTRLPRAPVSRAMQATRELLDGGYGRHHPSATRSWLYDVVRTPTGARSPL